MAVLFSICSQDGLTLAELSIVDLSSLTKVRDSAELLRMHPSDFLTILRFA